MLIETIKQVDELKAAIAVADELHAADQKARKKELAELESKVKQIGAGLNLEMVEAGSRIMRIQGSVDESAKRKELVSLAISDLAAGCPHLSKEYFGIKVYSGFGEQRSDHEYGYGPRHGSIVFRVELKDRKAPLTDEDREAAIYYLLNLSEIQKCAQTTTNNAA